MRTEVLVVGGGPAGMMAAYTAAFRGRKTLLLDKNDLLGRKLRITGKGRCNVTNDCDREEFLRNVPRNPKFLFSALERFGTRDTKDFFESRGVPLKTERGKRVFPVSDQAADIANALADGCRKAGVTVRKGNVTGLRLTEGRCGGVQLADGSVIFAESVILAAGGCSYPLTGSTGDGFRLAEQAGHTVVSPRPSLVGLVSRDLCCRDMQGLALKNVEAALWDRQKGKAVYRELGELLFTHFGLSGPLILSASAHIPKMEPERYEIRLDLKPGLDEQKLDARLLRDFADFANRDFANALEKLLPRSMIPAVVERSEIPPLQKVRDMTREQRKKLGSLLKCFIVSVEDFGPMEEAVVTAGGVSVKEIDPKSMASKRMPGLYFAGELLDVDGYTGGFNLQIAFSTGVAAGNFA